jgi:hypothetical protein
MRRFLRIHVDLPTLIVALVVLLFVHRPLQKAFFDLIGWVDTQYNLPDWCGTMGIAIVANVLALLLLGTIGFALFRIGSKAAIVGVFKAYDLTRGAREEWGTVRLTYNIFSRKIRGSITHNDIELTLEGVFDKGQYLRGHYWEAGNPARRRLGAFLLQLSGEGDSYEGSFAFVGPTTNNLTPSSGRVLWKKVTD